MVTEGGEILKADAVICAAPLNILADIAFEPALSPVKLATSRQRHAGQGTKTHILLEGEYANFSGWGPGDDAPMTDGWAIKERLDALIDGVVDAGECGVEASTVVEWVEGEPVVTRVGAGDPGLFA